MIRKKGYILAEIYKRKAGINGVTLKENYDKPLIKKSWEYGRVNKNYGVQFITGYYVGFEFIKELITSVKELAEIHLSVLEACCLYDGESFKRDSEFEKLGFNLYHAWLAIKYRTAKESEYLYITNLKHRAENLRKNNVPEELCSAVMILCLMKVFGMSSEDDYKIAFEWAKSQISDRLSELPREEVEYLKDFFNDIN